MFYKKYYYYISCILLLLFLFPNNLFSLTLTEEDDVAINASVLSDVVVTSSSSVGGGNIIFPETTVQFKGRAYPDVDVILLRDGVEISSVKASNDAYFTLSLPEENIGTNMYTLYAVDKNKQKSLFLNLPTKIEQGFLTYLNNILFAPTINSSKIEAKQNSPISFYGYSYPNALLELTIKNNSFSKKFVLTSKKDGYYETEISLNGFPQGDYNVFINYKNDTRLSKILRLSVSEKDILNKKELEFLPGDCNKDSVINLVDFSILAFWHKKDNVPDCVDLNKDGFATLVDFSILAYYWND